MGNCLSKKRDRPHESYEKHSVTKHNLRMGVQFEKSPEGEIHVGLKGGLEKKKDKSVHVDILEENVNKIPSVLDIVQHGETTKFSRDTRQDVTQEAFAIP